MLDPIQELGRRDWTRTNDPHHVKVTGSGEMRLTDNELNRPMTRVYDFSQLTRPLRTCYRAYASATTDGRIKVFVVQDEGMTPPDAMVYIASDTTDARDAAIELTAMIMAARTLAR